MSWPVPLASPIVYAPCADNVPLFRQATGVGHGALGLLSNLFPPAGQAAVALGFLLYETKPKTAADRLGAIQEYAVGYLAGKAFGVKGRFK